MSPMPRDHNGFSKSSWRPFVNCLDASQDTPRVRSDAPLAFCGSSILVSAEQELEEVPDQIKSYKRSDCKKRVS